jgi:uncharacterized protein YcbK (DUF882 family)
MIKANIENFTEKELSCRCCGKLIVNDKAVISLQAFKYYLQRKYKKNIRITINCSTRCPKHNKEVGGVANSEHLEGIAFDIVSPDLDYKILYAEAVASKMFSTVIRYDKSKFVHADTRERANFEINAWAWEK